MQGAESLTSDRGNPHRVAAGVHITSDVAVDISADGPDCEKLLWHTWEGTKLPTERPTNLNALGLECARAALFGRAWLCVGEAPEHCGERVEPERVGVPEDGPV